MFSLVVLIFLLKLLYYYDHFTRLKLCFPCAKTVTSTMSNSELFSDVSVALSLLSTCCYIIVALQS